MAEEDLSQVEFETSEDVEVIQSFDQLKLREDLVRGIYAYGFEKPTAIQQRAIKPITKGRDVIAQAQSGTGKTGTFSISALQMVDTTIRETQVMVGSNSRIGYADAKGHFSFGRLYEYSMSLLYWWY